MRPIRLTLRAFGSYGEQQTVDFTRPDQNLFLITGDTGSGKSTLFDAIVFALYGEASSTSNRKDGQELQSQYVGYDVSPFVELTFSEAGEGYTVRRSPRHLRSKKRGAGVTDQAEVVELTLPDGSDYPAREADKKLVELVGLTKDQFMQVAMIAQGEFMELLRAKSDDKKAIFRKLFGTGLYQQIVDELARRRKEKAAEIARIRTACQTEAAHIVVPEDYPEAEAVGELRRRVLEAERLNVVDMEKLMAALDGLCGWLDQRRDAARQIHDAQSKLRDECRDRLTAAEALDATFRQLERSRAELAACEAEAERVAEAGKLIEAIGAAYEIQGVYNAWADAGRAADETRARLEQQRTALPGLTEAHDAAMRSEAEAQERQHSTLKAYTVVAERVEKALEVLKQIEAARREAEQTQADCRRSEADAELARQALTAFEAQVKAWQAQIEALSDAGAALERWRAKRAEADQLEKELQEVKALESAGLLQRKRAALAGKEYADIRDQYRAAEDDYQRKQAAFLDAQAGFIAQRWLKPGAPCPVCGSTEHPMPCRLAEAHRGLTRERVEALGAEVQKLQAAMSEKSGAAGIAARLTEERDAQCAAALDRLRARMRERIPDLPDGAGLGDLERILPRWAKRVMAEGIQIKADAEALAQAQASIKGAEDRRSALSQATEDAAKRLSALREALAAGRSRLSECESRRDYPTAEAAKGALRQAEALRAEAEQVCSEAQRLTREAGNRQRTCEALIQRDAESLPGLEQKRVKAREAYDGILSEKDMGEAEWQSVVGKHRKTEVAGLRAEIDAHNARKAGARGAIEAAEKAIGDREKPDLEALRDAFREAEDGLSSAKLVYDGVREQCRVNRAALDALAPQLQARGEVMRDFNRVEMLYRRLAGNETGARMDIETFVQRYYLNRILRAANLRFREMSAGQFELRMVPQEQAGTGRNRGLDLMVYSNVTGKEREVRTLSGGESFMAALSLALGMADQIQQSAAAVNLDVMFIDEGFGSLDDHAREQAVRVLRQMAGGERLIGIISHVSELKTEIEDQLLVTKDERGSHTRWQIS